MPFYEAVEIEIVDFKNLSSMISCKFMFGGGRRSLTRLKRYHNIKCSVSASPISGVRENSTDIKQKKIGIIGMGQVGIKQ